jgi:NAD(P)-dependent dehydrogenase (short-subunit alcohol dehydrogenase family)
MNIAGKVALITGGGSGIGKALVMKLARESCRLAIASNVEAENEQAVAAAKELGAEAAAFYVDLSDLDACGQLIPSVVKTFGTLDILVNSAGIHQQHPFAEYPLENWQKVIRINVDSIFVLCQQAMNHMKKDHDGYIINVSAGVGISTRRNRGTDAAYVASKAAILGLSSACYYASKTNEYGVRVSSLIPGTAVDTPMAKDIDFTGSDIKWLTADDVADAALFLLKTDKRVLVRELIVDAMNA